MSLVQLRQSSSGRPFIGDFLRGTPSPNGKALFVEVGQVAQNYDLVLVPTASPKDLYRIGIYTPGRISLGKIAQLCGLYYDEIITEVKRLGLHLNFGPRTPEEAERELQSIRRHMRRSSN